MIDELSAEFLVKVFQERYPGESAAVLDENVRLALESVQANTRRRALVDMLAAEGVTLERTAQGINNFVRYILRDQEQPLLEQGPYVTQARYANVKVAADLIHGGGETVRDGPLVENRKLPRAESQEFLSRIQRGGLVGFWERLRKGYRYSIVKEELVYTNGEKGQLSDGNTKFIGDTLTVIRRQVPALVGGPGSLIETRDLTFKDLSLDQLDVYISGKKMTELDNRAVKYQNEELERWKKQAGEVFAYMGEVDNQLKQGKSIEEILQELQFRRGDQPPPGI